MDSFLANIPSVPTADSDQEVLGTLREDSQITKLLTFYSVRLNHIKTNW